MLIWNLLACMRVCTVRSIEHGSAPLIAQTGRRIFPVDIVSDMGDEHDTVQRTLYPGTAQRPLETSCETRSSMSGRAATTSSCKDAS